MRRVMVCAGLVGMLLMGCGGGGGGSEPIRPAPDGVDRELERSMAFHDAAIERVLAHIIVTCERVECPWLRGGASVRQGEDREQSVCVHGCVAVELPGEHPGEVETRFFLVEHAYTRPLNGCYVEPQVEVAVAHPVPCLDDTF
jgi:hypothetical protein